MTQRDFSELEMELRVLGRQLGEQRPSPALIQRATTSASAHLILCAQATVRRRSRLLLGTLVIAMATLPIPLLFLWGDWTAASALFGKVLSPTASEVASSVYLWMKLCALGLIYLLVIPMLALWALRMNASIGDHGEMSVA